MPWLASLRHGTPPPSLTYTSILSPDNRIEPERRSHLFHLHHLYTARLLICPAM